MKRLALILLGTALVACASSFKRAEPDAFVLSVADNPARQRYDLVLLSRTDKPLCLSSESWPAEDGTFPLASDEVAILTTSTGRLQPEAVMTAYCPGGFRDFGGYGWGSLVERVWQQNHQEIINGAPR